VEKPQRNTGGWGIRRARAIRTDRKASHRLEQLTLAICYPIWLNARPRRYESDLSLRHRGGSRRRISVTCDAAGLASTRFLPHFGLREIRIGSEAVARMRRTEQRVIRRHGVQIEREVASLHVAVRTMAGSHGRHGKNITSWVDID
jgi:DNA-binding protein